MTKMMRTTRTITFRNRTAQVTVMISRIQVVKATIIASYKCKLVSWRAILIRRKVNKPKTAGRLRQRTKVVKTKSLNRR